MAPGVVSVFLLGYRVLASSGASGQIRRGRGVQQPVRYLYLRPFRHLHGCWSTLWIYI